jgi:putative inorganic carbon (HCO3(-)) transporter
VLQPATVVAEPALQPCGRAPTLVFLLAWASAVSILFSIAVSQILLGAGILALLISGERLRLPPLKLPLAALFATTIIADLLSGDPVHGLPQIRKLYVFLILVLVYSGFRTVAHIQALVLGWSAIAAVSGLCGIVQFAMIRREAFAENANDYGFFLYHRITGFASHWMTFGGEEMIVVLVLAAFLLFSQERRWRVSTLAALLVILVAIALGLTRSVLLLGLPAGGAYLLWHRKRWLLAALPVLAVLAFFLLPFQVRERVVSALRPHPEMDSNTQRMVMVRTGLAMIGAHPWFGLGPEEIAPHFLEYVPADIPRPLPQGWYGHLHNIYLQYAAERGIFGLAAVLWLIGKVLFDFSRALRRASGGSRFVLLGGIAVAIAILAEGLFEHNLGDSEILTMFLAVVACGYRAALQNDQARLV